jgi:hypothetical protein
VVDRGCLKKLKVTGIGSMVNEVDLKGVDEAWALPEVQKKFIESQSELKPVLSLSLELSSQAKDDLISYDCSKTVHKDPFESDEDSRVIDQVIMSSPGVYLDSQDSFNSYDRYRNEALSEPIYQDEYEIMEEEEDYYLDEYFEKVVYEPLFVQPVSVYYEEFEEYPRDFMRGGRPYSRERGYGRHQNRCQPDELFRRQHQESEYHAESLQQRQHQQAQGSRQSSKYQSPLQRQQAKTAEILHQPEVSSEDDLLL